MRSESLFFLFSPVTRIKGIGGATAKALQRLLPSSTARDERTVPIIRDILFHLPVGIVDRRFTCPLNSAPDGAIATFVVQVDEHFPPPPGARGRRPYRVLCSNETGDITLVFFHVQGDYLKNTLPVGQKRVISGRTEYFDYRLQMTHPDVIAPVNQLASVQQAEAVYPLTLGLTSRRIAKIVESALEKLPELPEWIKDKPWPSWKEALASVHHPQKPEDLQPDTPARMRLAYDEMLANQLHLALLRRNMQQQAGEVITGNGSLTGALVKSLPYTLTAGQQRVLGEIDGDLRSGGRMIRILQGDVGSGKTIVALISMLKVVEEGMQAALMVPTELIARQHYEGITRLLAKVPSPLEGEGKGGGWPQRGYTPVIRNNAQSLRKEQTEAEKKLWQLLRGKQLGYYKFRRQQPVGNYIADFTCPDKMLVIELDGGQHTEQHVYDEQRTKFLESCGYRVLRFWNTEVLENIEGVYERIAHAVATPHPTLPLKGGGLKVVLLTGSIKGKQREQALSAIASGEANIVIGTHALFQEHVEFKNLALAVIDEQHRFGVNQRMALTAKGKSPHLLHMSATPIPRSLTMTLYGDMDCSLLREKPANRQPIVTRTIPLNRYDDVMERLGAALKRGEKAYWICPLIEEKYTEGELELSPEKDLAAAEARYTEFKARFGDTVGLVHGRMKGAARDAAMQDFASGKTNLLVATTVVEVGVDVPDATIMVIEKAERFGLSQLHQLRGRVGRGSKASFCVLLYSSSPLVGEARWGGAFNESSPQIQSPLPDPPPQGGRENPALQRLSVLRETEDGFRIAEADLAIRGGGDLLGTRQSGLPRFIFMNFFAHLPLIAHAREDIRELLEDDPELTSERGKALRLLLQLFEYE